MYNRDMQFEWDNKKNLINIKKHGLFFEQAQEAFFDKKRIIVVDVRHSNEEKRYFCLGIVKGKVVLQQLDLHCETGKYVLLEQDIGQKGGKGMKNKIEYAKAPKRIGKSILEGKIAADILPPPEFLTRKESRKKITIALTERSLKFFKQNAKKYNVKYQTMINEVLDMYSQKHAQQ